MKTSKTSQSKSSSATAATAAVALFFLAIAVIAPPASATENLRDARFGFGLTGGPALGTGVGHTYLEANVGVGLFTYDLGFLFYPGSDMGFYETGALIDTTAFIWGFTLGAGYTHVSESENFLWTTGLGAIVDRGGVEGDKEHYFRGTLQTRFDVRLWFLFRNDDSPAWLRFGYRLDVYPDSMLGLFKDMKIRGGQSAFVTHSLTIGLMLLGGI